MSFIRTIDIWSHAIQLRYLDCDTKEYFHTLWCALMALLTLFFSKLIINIKKNKLMMYGTLFATTSLLIQFGHWVNSFLCRINLVLWAICLRVVTFSFVAIGEWKQLLGISRMFDLKYAKHFIMWFGIL